jgi:hypothetical protein
MTTKRSINEIDIAELQELLKGTDAELVTPKETEAYTKSIHRWSSAAVKPAGACLVGFDRTKCTRDKY